MEALPYRIADAVTQAFNNTEGAEIGFAVGHTAEFAKYRRLRLKDGTLRMLWLVTAEDEVIGPSGAVDPDLPVLAVRATDGRLLGLVVSYSAHATNGVVGRWSASYPGQIAAELSRRVGVDPGRILFMPGASGNIEPGSPDPISMGLGLAKVAVEALSAVRWQPDAVLKVQEEPLQLPARQLEEFPVGLVASVYEPWRRRAPADFARVVRYFATEYIRLAERGNRPYETQIQALAIGDFAIAAIPGEPFVELGHEIKRRSPWPTTVVASLANDTVGYIPDLASLADGGYEVIPAWQSRLAPEAAEMVVDAAIRLLQGLAATPGSA